MELAPQARPVAELRKSVCGLPRSLPKSPQSACHGEAKGTWEGYAGLCPHEQGPRPSGARLLYNGVDLMQSCARGGHVRAAEHALNSERLGVIWPSLARQPCPCANQTEGVAQKVSQRGGRGARTGSSMAGERARQAAARLYGTLVRLRKDISRRASSGSMAKRASALPAAPAQANKACRLSIESNSAFVQCLNGSFVHASTLPAASAYGMQCVHDGLLVDKTFVAG